MRKTPFIIGSLILVILIIFGALYLILKDFQRRALQQSADPFALVPADATFLFHIRSPVLFIESITRTGPLAEDLGPVLAVAEVETKLTHLDSISRQYPEVFEVWEMSSVLISGHQGLAGQNLNYLIQIVTPGGLSERQKTDLLNQHFSQGEPIDQYSFENHTIMVYEFEGKQAGFVWSGNSLLISYSTTLIEQAVLNSINKSGVDSIADIGELRAVAGRFSDNLYWDTRSLCRLIEKYPDFKWPLLLSCDQVNGWHGWDISYNSGYIVFNGFTLPSPGMDNLAALLEHQRPFQSSFAEHIPMHTGFVLYLGFSDTDVLKQKLGQLYSDPLNEEIYSTMVRRFTDITGLSADSLSALWKGELAWILFEGSPVNDHVLMLDIEDKDHIANHPQLNIFMRDHVQENETGTLISADIRQVNIPGFIPVLTNGLVVDEYEYITFSGPYLLAAHSPDILLTYLDKLRFGRNFAQGRNIRFLQDQLSDNQNVLMHISLPVLLSSLEKTSDKQELVMQMQHKEHLRNIGNVSIQFTPSPGNMVFSNWLIQHTPDYVIGNPRIWQVELKTEIFKGPFRVFNHNDRSPEIIVQDMANNLYLIDVKGNVMWEKELSGPIMSDIYQVDIYKNNRYQYLFNTRNYLHLIDRNGNYVRGYPMRLPSPASAGIAVFDYDKNKNYRIIFPSENRRIYNYNLARRPVRGWNYKLSRQIVESPLQHIRMSGKDFLFVVDTNGNLEILDRRGTSRINPRQTFRVNPAIRVYASTIDDDPHFMMAGENGTLNRIRLDGTTAQFAPDTFSLDYRFLYADLIGDKEMEMIYLDRNVLSVFNVSDRLLFSLPLPGTEKSEPVLLLTKDSGKFIGVVDKENNLVFLVDRNGRVVYPFPVPGNKSFYFDYDQDDNQLFFTGLDKFVICYKIDL